MEGTGDPRCLVIGAGLAGLVAAYTLSQRGVDVTVLESEPRPGGRMTSEHVDGFVVDRGAQFLSTGYPRYDLTRWTDFDSEAGDVWARLGLPFTDSVTHTGQWAAAQALRLLT